MKQKANLTMFLSAIIMMFALFCGTALAKQPVCGGLTGTWHGTEPGDITWLAIHTSDSMNRAKGEMLMNWIWVKPNLIGGPDNSLTPGQGVWQLNGDGMYDYTWYAFVLDPVGIPFGTLRVSGVASFYPYFDRTEPLDCNTVYIYYEFTGAFPAADVGELDDDIFMPGPIGVAVQTRVPMVVTPLPPLP